MKDSVTFGEVRLWKFYLLFLPSHIVILKAILNLISYALLVLNFKRLVSQSCHQMSSVIYHIWNKTSIFSASITKGWQCIYLLSCGCFTSHLYYKNVYFFSTKKSSEYILNTWLLTGLWGGKVSSFYHFCTWKWLFYRREASFNLWISIYMNKTAP